MVNKIYFNEKLHKYTDENQNVYTSVTTIIGKYEHPFDIEDFSRRCAFKKGSPYENMNPTQVKMEWKRINKEACDKGTKKHNYLENIIKTSTGYKLDDGYINDRIYTIDEILLDNSFGELSLDKYSTWKLEEKYPKIDNIIKVLYNEGYKLYSEVCVYDSNRLISGLIDILCIRGEEFLILDWKTNKHKIMDKSGYFKKDRQGKSTGEFVETNKFFKYPLVGLQESKKNIYNMQLSLYAYLVKQRGLKLNGLILAHMRGEEGEEEITDILKMTYLEDYVEKMIGHFCAMQPKNLFTL